MACILLWSSAVRVHNSQAYRKMDVKAARELYTMFICHGPFLMSQATEGHEIKSEAGVSKDGENV